MYIVPGVHRHYVVYVYTCMSIFIVYIVCCKWVLTLEIKHNELLRWDINISQKKKNSENFSSPHKRRSSCVHVLTTDKEHRQEYSSQKYNVSERRTYLGHHHLQDHHMITFQNLNHLMMIMTEGCFYHNSPFWDHVQINYQVEVILYILDLVLSQEHKHLIETLWK